MAKIEIEKYVDYQYKSGLAFTVQGRNAVCLCEDLGIPNAVWIMKENKWQASTFIDGTDVERVDQLKAFAKGVNGSRAICKGKKSCFRVFVSD